MQQEFKHLKKNKRQDTLLPDCESALGQEVVVQVEDAFRRCQILWVAGYKTLDGKLTKKELKNGRTIETVFGPGALGDYLPAPPDAKYIIGLQLYPQELF